MYDKRLDAKEWMDLGYYSPKEYSDCLYQLDRIGSLLGGNKATLSAFDALKMPPKKILDVGCGGGSFALQLAQRYPDAKIVGIDIAPEAIEYARRQHREKFPTLHNIEFIATHTPHLQYSPKSFDVVTSTLVCHHLSDHEICEFLKEASTIARHAVIINDLHRHPIAALAFKIISPILFRNNMIAHDGLLSVKRAFSRDDWIRYFQAAGICQRKDIPNLALGFPMDSNNRYDHQRFLEWIEVCDLRRRRRRPMREQSD